MYLATISRAGTRRYEIRQSYLHDTDFTYQYRVIFDLGSNPRRYIEQLSDDICFFASELEDPISAATNEDPTSLLEELLWDFLPAEERHRLGIFRHRGRARIRPLSIKDRAAIEKQVHLFDRRRLYYLRYGAVDQSRIFRLNLKLYHPLLGQSRDEREYYFMELEKVLNLNEMKTYVFAIFDLQRHFNETYSSTMPEALNQLDISEHFLNDLCNLNEDADFWSGSAMTDSLHEHLIKYLIMFFDHGYGRRSLFDDFIKEFMGRHRAFQWPKKKPQVSTSEAASAFNTEWKSLQKMSKNELTRLYRSRAKELHPDSGGNHEQFVRLSTAYASLLVRKK